MSRFIACNTKTFSLPFVFVLFIFDLNTKYPLEGVQNRFHLQNALSILFLSFRRREVVILSFLLDVILDALNLLTNIKLLCPFLFLQKSCSFSCSVSLYILYGTLIIIEFIECSVPSIIPLYPILYINMFSFFISIIFVYINV